MSTIDNYRKNMLDYIKSQPCGVMYAIQDLENATMPIIRYVYCLCKDAERYDRKIKHLQDELKVYHPTFDYNDYIDYDD